MIPGIRRFGSDLTNSPATAPHHEEQSLWLSVWEAKSEKKELERTIQKWENALQPLCNAKNKQLRQQPPLVSRLSALLDLVTTATATASPHRQPHHQPHQPPHYHQQQPPSRQQRTTTQQQQYSSRRQTTNSTNTMTEIEEMFAAAASTTAGRYNHQHQYEHEHKAATHASSDLYCPPKLTLTSFATHTPRQFDGNVVGQSSTLVARPAWVPDDSSPS